MDIVTRGTRVQRTSFVYVPAQYYALAQSARKNKEKYRVTEMDSTQFFDFKYTASLLCQHSLT